MSFWTILKNQPTIWVFEAWIAGILISGIPSTNAVVMSETRQAATGICSGNPGSQKHTKNHVHYRDYRANSSCLRGTGNNPYGHVTYPLILDGSFSLSFCMCYFSDTWMVLDEQRNSPDVSRLFIGNGPSKWSQLFDWKFSTCQLYCFIITFLAIGSHMYTSIHLHIVFPCLFYISCSEITVVNTEILDYDDRSNSQMVHWPWYICIKDVRMNVIAYYKSYALVFSVILNEDKGTRWKWYWTHCSYSFWRNLHLTSFVIWSFLRQFNFHSNVGLTTNHKPELPKVTSAIWKDTKSTVPRRARVVVLPLKIVNLGKQPRKTRGW